MPAKQDDNTNLRFMHACLLASDYSRIDFNGVSAKFGIQAPAARMRFARLHQSLGGPVKRRKRAGSNGDHNGNGSGSGGNGGNGYVSKNPGNNSPKRKDIGKCTLGKGKFAMEGEDDEEAVVGLKVEEGDAKIKKEEDHDSDEPLATMRTSFVKREPWSFGAPISQPTYYGPPYGIVPPHLRQREPAVAQPTFFAPLSVVTEQAPQTIQQETDMCQPSYFASPVVAKEERHDADVKARDMYTKDFGADAK